VKKEPVFIKPEKERPRSGLNHVSNQSQKQRLKVSANRILTTTGRIRGSSEGWQAGEACTHTRGRSSNWTRASQSSKFEQRLSEKGTFDRGYTAGRIEIYEMMTTDNLTNQRKSMLMDGERFSFQSNELSHREKENRIHVAVLSKHTSGRQPF
jgi:hypothetical protein